MPESLKNYTSHNSSAGNNLVNKAFGFIPNNTYFILLVCLSYTLPLPRIFNSLALITLLLYFIFSANYANKWSNLKRHRIPWLLMGIFLLHLLGMLYTENIKEGLLRIERLLPLLLLPIVIFGSQKISTKQFHIILRFFVVGMATISVIAVLTAFYKRNIIGGLSAVEENNFYIELPHLFMHHIYYGYYLLISIIILTYFLAYLKSALTIKVLYLVTLIIFTTLLVLTSGFFTLLILILLLLMAFAKIALSSNRTVRILFLSVLVLLPLAFHFISSSSSNTVHRYRQRLDISFNEVENNQYNYASSRLGPLLTGIDLANEIGLFGVGTGDIGDNMTVKYHEKGLSNLAIYNTHNQYLDYFISFGFVGLIYLIFVLIYILISSIRYRFYLLTAFVVMFSLSFITENVLEANKGIILFAFFGSLISAYMVSKNKHPA